MDSDDDPFGLMDSERTQFARPVPGGRPTRAPSPLSPGAPPPPPPRQPPRRAGGAAAVSGTPGRGPLVECAFGLLSLAPLLRARTPPAEPEQLRAQVESDLRVFSDRAQAKGLDGRLVGLGHYALCALLDDVVLNTPWGARGAWRANSLAGALHHDAAAGEHFFDYLEQAKAQPERTRPVLELMAACLALGFEGQYRIAPQGQAALQQIRTDLYSTLRRMGGGDDGELSPHWRGAAAAHVPISRRVPLWVYGSAALALLVVVYAGLAVRLGADSERLGDTVASLPPGPVNIVRQTAALPVAPQLVAVPRAAALEPRLRACLPEPTRSRPEAVAENFQGLRIRLPSAGLFASGSAELQPAVEPLIACLAGVLRGAEGRITVVGHTDNVPIRTARFPTNWELSKARAEAVAAVARPVVGAGRLQVAGRSDTEPVAPNATDDGRSQNRRVEVLLVR
jgi:type VI secretion system protein ImpK